MGYQVDTYPKARKNHTCYECGFVIPKGEVYHNQRNNHSDGHPFTWKVHKQCAQLYFALNKGRLFQSGEGLETHEFALDEMEHLRGLFPHAVNRWDLRKQLSDLRA